MSGAHSTLWTIGHSTRTAAELVDLLVQNGISTLVDVRTVPRSRRNEQFNKDVLPATLAAVDLAYRHEPRLGGLRKPKADSPNSGWKNAGFRGYADHMQTPRFVEALDELIDLVRDGRTCVMCAEAVPWRCHRSLIADAATVRELEVRHILGPGSIRPHRLTPFARIDGCRITYPGLV